MEVEMSDPNTLQDNETPKETRIPQSAEVTTTDKVPQILATIAGTQCPPYGSIMTFSDIVGPANQNGCIILCVGNLAVEKF
jgi:hypothetical protein